MYGYTPNEIRVEVTECQICKEMPTFWGNQGSLWSFGKDKDKAFREIGFTPYQTSFKELGTAPSSQDRDTNLLHPRGDRNHRREPPPGLRGRDLTTSGEGQGSAPTTRKPVSEKQDTRGPRKDGNRTREAPTDERAPERSFLEEKSIHGASEPPAADTTNFEINSLQQFSDLIHRRLRRTCHRSQDRILAECYNSVARETIKLAFDILSPHLESQKALAKAVEACEEKMNVQSIEHSNALDEQRLQFEEAKAQAIKDKDEQWEQITSNQKRMHANAIAELNDKIAQQIKDLKYWSDQAAESDRRVETLEVVVARKNEELAAREESIDRRDRKICDHENTITQKEKDIVKKDKDIAKKDKEIGKKDNAIAKHNFEVEELCRDYENQMKEKKRKFDLEKATLKSNQTLALENLRETHRGEMKQQEEKNTGMLESLRLSLEETKRSAESDMKQKIKEHDAMVEKLSEEHTARVNSLRHDLGEARRTADYNLNQKIEEHRDMVERLSQEHKLAISTLKQANSMALQQQKQEYELATREIHSDRQELNSALLARDNKKYQAALFQTHGLPRKTDDQIRNSFAGIQQLVEDLGRLTWTKDQPTWTEQLLQKAGNQRASRELKRAIVQDAIWAILFKFVFSSPFRIFGEAGRLLEQQWVEHSGESMYPLALD